MLSFYRFHYFFFFKYQSPLSVPALLITFFSKKITSFKLLVKISYKFFQLYRELPLRKSLVILQSTLLEPGLFEKIAAADRQKVSFCQNSFFFLYWSYSRSSQALFRNFFFFFPKYGKNVNILQDVSSTEVEDTSFSPWFRFLL